MYSAEFPREQFYVCMDLIHKTCFDKTITFKLPPHLPGTNVLKSAIVRYQDIYQHSDAKVWVPYVYGPSYL